MANNEVVIMSKEDLEGLIDKSIRKGLNQHYKGLRISHLDKLLKDNEMIIETLDFIKSWIKSTPKNETEPIKQEEVTPEPVKEEKQSESPMSLFDRLSDADKEKLVTMKSFGNLSRDELFKLVNTPYVTKPDFLK